MSKICFYKQKKIFCANLVSLLNLLCDFFSFNLLSHNLKKVVFLTFGDYVKTNIFPFLIRK